MVFMPTVTFPTLRPATCAVSLETVTGCRQRMDAYSLSQSCPPLAQVIRLGPIPGKLRQDLMNAIKVGITKVETRRIYPLGFFFPGPILAGTVVLDQEGNLMDADFIRPVLSETRKRSPFPDLSVSLSLGEKSPALLAHVIVSYDGVLLDLRWPQPQPDGATKSQVQRVKRMLQRMMESETNRTHRARYLRENPYDLDILWGTDKALTMMNLNRFLKALINYPDSARFDLAVFSGPRQSFRFDMTTVSPPRKDHAQASAVLRIKIEKPFAGKVPIHFDYEIVSGVLSPSLLSLLNHVKERII